MSEVHIVAIFFPSPGKVDRMRQVLSDQAATVHAVEDYATRFVVTEELHNPDSPRFCLFETYLSEEATNRHLAEPHFKKMTETMKAEGLSAREPQVIKTVSIAGFDTDRRLIEGGKAD